MNGIIHSLLLTVIFGAFIASAQREIPAETLILDDGTILQRFDKQVSRQGIAVEDCEYRDALLVRIKDGSKQNDTEDLLFAATGGNSNDDYYIGLNWVEGGWKWNDDDPLGSYNNWGGGEGGGGTNQECASIQRTGNHMWTDVTCTAQRRYICQSQLTLAKTKYTDDGYKLELYTNKFHQSEADKFCKSRSGFLVRIRNDAMKQVVVDLLSDQSNSFAAYIDLTRTSTADHWYWGDGQELGPGANWAGGEGGDQNCALVKNNGEWVDYACWVASGYICQYDLLTISPVNEQQVVIQGETTSITINIVSQDGAVNIEVFKLPDETNPVHSKDDHTADTYTYTTDSVNDSQNVTYKFVVSPTSKSYSRETSVGLYVHFPVSITNLTPTTISSPVTIGLDHVTCTVSGAPPAKVKWFRNNIEVSTVTGSSVYQVKSNQQSILYIDNALLIDDGIYTCRGINNIGEESQEKTAEKEIVLSVYGSPEIIQATANKCSVDGQVIVEWKPNNQTTNIIHKIEAINERDAVGYSQNITAQTQQETEIKQLNPYTNYSIQITVCPDDCISKLYTESKIITGVGIPDPVADVKSTPDTNATFCIVSWSWSDSIPRNTVDFVITAESTIALLSPTTEQQSFSNDHHYAGETLEYFQAQIPSKANRNYTFYVKSSTCAGGSERVKAVGECITDVAAPASVPAPEPIASTENLPTQSIEVVVPDELNGPISCLFVMMTSSETVSQQKSGITIDQLTEASQAAANGGANKEYLAVAIPRSTISGQSKQVTLGSGESTSCDISAPTVSTRTKRATAQPMTGRNLELQSGLTYTYSIVSSTPSAITDDVSLNRSPDGSFEHIYNEDASLAWIAGLVGGLALIVAIVLLLIAIRRKHQQKSADPTDQPDSNLYPLPSTKDNDDEDAVYENLGATLPDDSTTTSIALDDLYDVFEDKNAKNGKKFMEEFTNLKREAVTVFSTDMASNELLKSKNRYKNILPFDLSRVHLKGEHEETYINACYVHGYSKSKKFIATQGPLPSTINDFWRMIVEQKSIVIVMLTKCVEAQKRKCEKYWPDLGMTLKYGEIKVSCDNEENFGGYKRRTFTIHASDAPGYQIEQYHFLNWPDHGVPATTSNFYRFYDACMMSQGNRNKPIIVHCSAGAGRTGAFIGYDCLIEEAARTKRVDIYQCVIKMRQQRIDMVQTCDQYKLLHKFLFEYHLFKDTDADEIEINVKIQEDKGYAHRTSRIKKEFENIQTASNVSKISAKHAEKYKVIIMWQQGDGNEIPRLNANHLETYNESLCMIACEGPTLANVENFWRAVIDSDVTTIVMLNELVKQNVHNIQYWPSDDGESDMFGQVSVHLMKSCSIGQYVERHFMVTRGVEQKAITQYHILGWRSNACPDDPTTVIDVINKIQTNNKRRDVSTVLVHCRDGLGRTGAFCSIMNLVDRLKVEAKADVFKVVKDLRDCRPGMLQTLDEYRFCYRAIGHWLKTGNVYEDKLVEENTYENTVRLHGQESAYENHQISV